MDSGKVKSYLSVLFMSCSILMVGCGGGGGSDNAEVPIPSAGAGLTTGVFLDSAVSGLEYLSGGKSSLTDANGTFEVDGMTVQFSIGDIVLGEGTAKSVMTPIDLVPGAIDETDPAVSNIVRLLLTLDDDENPDNGIQIRQEVSDATTGKSINFTQSTAAFESDVNVQSIVSELTALTTSGTRSLISASDAQEHLRNTLLGIRSFTLNITTAGDGSGTVTSTPDGINCGLDCSKIYADQTSVTLTATQTGGATFSGWSGNADCIDGAVSMTANLTCTATFNLPSSGAHTLTITKGGTGSGTITSNPSGINCGTRCTSSFSNNTGVTLTATPSGNSSFSGWSGDPDCVDGSVNMTANKTCITTFNLLVVPEFHPLTLTKEGTGNGTVTSTPVGIDCGVTCSANFSNETNVTLTPMPSGDSTFSGWGGDPDCSDGAVTMTVNKTCTVTFILPTLPGGNIIWDRQVTGESVLDVVKSSDVVSFSDGSSVVIGTFDDTAIFGSGETNETRLEGRRGFIARYHANGTLAWAKEHSTISVVAVSSDEGFFVTGGLRCRICLPTVFGAGETNETSLFSGRRSDIYIARYNADSTLVWAKQVEGSITSFSGTVNPVSMVSFSDGSFVVSGNFSGSVKFGPGESNETNFSSVAQRNDMFIARYNADGTLAWAKQVASSTISGVLSGNGIASFSDGSFIVTGLQTGTAGKEFFFGAGETNETTLTLSSGGSFFIARYNADGTLAWAKQVDGTRAINGKDVASFSDGSFVVTGSFVGFPRFGAGEANVTTLRSVVNRRSGSATGDIFIARYNADGTLSWAKQAGGQASDGSWYLDIAPFSDGSSIVTGTFENTAIFGADEVNETTLSSVSELGSFIARYNADGTLSWAKQAEETLNRGSGLAGGVASFSDGSSVVTGSFINTFDILNTFITRFSP